MAKREEGESAAEEQLEGRGDEATTVIAIGDDLVTVSPDELEELLDCLRRLDDRDAAAVADDIAALRLVGGVIRLTPTEAELAALHDALADESQPRSEVLARLACLGVAAGAAEVQTA